MPSVECYVRKKPCHTAVLSVMEEEKPLLPGVNVKAATIDKLLQICVENFSPLGVIDNGSDFPKVFFLMHEWFMPSESLANGLVNLYKKCDATVVCDVPECQHSRKEESCKKQQQKTRICFTFRYWINNFPLHFDCDKRLSLVIQEFSYQLKSEGNCRLKDLVDLSRVQSCEWNKLSIRNPSFREKRKVSLVFNHLEPGELAEQLTVLEYKAFRRINFCDFKKYAQNASLKDNPKLERSIALFNGLSQWVQCMVLCKTTPQQRADVMVKFVNVSKKLKQLQNFNTLMAVVGGLTHSALARLSKTSCCLPSETQKILQEYTELLGSNNNFGNYRKALQQSTGFKIPILGVHLKDLIITHMCSEDKVSNEINFRKVTQLSLIFQEILKLQQPNVKMPVEANKDLMNTLRLSLDMQYTEDEIYELSLAREPRTSFSTPSTPTKQCVFGDWVAGVSPPDPATVNKHVHDMVEAVFQNYDHDKDGFISHGEFELIAGNFPFIDSFCVLDADKDGVISREEMKDYFIRANSLALRNRFKHDFHENTYFKPTYCIHCTGLCSHCTTTYKNVTDYIKIIGNGFSFQLRSTLKLGAVVKLWGLIKQGWKCRECGINAHKHCRDLVVMECKKPGSKRHDSVSSNGSDTQESVRPLIRNHKQRRSTSKQHKSTQTDVFELEFDAMSLREDKAASAVSVKDSVRIGDLQDKLKKSEETCRKLKAENEWIHDRLRTSSEQNVRLKTQISSIRQNTISNILHHMDLLNEDTDSKS